MQHASSGKSSLTGVSWDQIVLHVAMLIGTSVDDECIPTSQGLLFILEHLLSASLHLAT